MKILYFDCFSGISGDMTIGALLDLGIDREKFLNELARLKLEGYKIEIGTKTVNGIRGTDVNVVLTDEDSIHNHEHEHEYGHDHGHDHGQEHEHGHDHGQEHDHELGLSNEHQHEHEHDHDHEQGHDYDHEHNHERGLSNEHQHEHEHDHTHDHTHVHTQGERGLAEIENILDQSSLSYNIKDFSKKVFREIAAAEAKVHGKPVSEVHFHEVGAIDSIVDIAGTAICLELLGVEKVYSSALHDGNGFIECRHGIIPVPVPAVMEMLAGSGIPLVSEDVGTELVTPTGMGLIKSLAASFGRMPAMKIEKTGYGHGKRNTGRLNALRVILGETLEETRDVTSGAKGSLNFDSAVDLAANTATDTAAATAADTAANTAVATAAATAAINAAPTAASNTTPDGSAVCRDEIVLLETNIDDTTSEILGYAMTKLLEAGALDVFCTPVFMKKNRPAYMLTVLAKPGSEDMLVEIILGETSTLGIRMSRMGRYCMDRETIQIETEYGSARVKIATFRDIKKASPEYEDCRRIAQDSGLALLKVYEIVKKKANEQIGL